MLEEGQKRKSARISALEASKSNKMTKNNDNNTSTTPQAQAENSQKNATSASGVGPRRRKGPKRKRLEDVAKTCVATQTQQVSENPKHEKSKPRRKPGRKNIQAGHGYNKILPGFRDLNSCQRRQTYRPSTTVCNENESMVSTIYNSCKELVPANGGSGYTESLLRFVKDLGPTAQKVAAQKLASCSTVVPNYQSQTLTCSARNPNSLICSSSAEKGPNRMFSGGSKLSVSDTYLMGAQQPDLVFMLGTQPPPAL